MGSRSRKRGRTEVAAAGAPAAEPPAPGETPPGETPSGETPPGETPPGETPPGEAPPGEAPPGEALPGEAPPGETPSAVAPPGEALPGEAPPGETPSVAPPAVAPAQRAAPASDEVDPLRRRYARGRARDEAIRESLEPLHPGERPGAVTAAAIVAFVFAAANVAAALTGNDLSTADGNASAATAVTTALLLLAGIGMLLRQYWAVLGFQTILAVQIIFFSLALLRVQKWWLAILLVIAIGLLGWLFWKLIRAMARLQMPDRGSLTAPREP